MIYFGFAVILTFVNFDDYSDSIANTVNSATLMVVSCLIFAYFTYYFFWYKKESWQFDHFPGWLFFSALILSLIVDLWTSINIIFYCWIPNYAPIYFDNFIISYPFIQFIYRFVSAYMLFLYIKENWHIIKNIEKWNQMLFSVQSGSAETLEYL